MLIFFPFLFLIITYLILRNIWRDNNIRRFSIREALVWAVIIWVTALVFSLEILSFFSLINAVFLALSWTILSLIAGFILIVLLKATKWHYAPKRTGKIIMGWSSKILLLVVMFIVILTGATAIIAPPNNSDAMIYHLSRVAHWAQNQSLANYPTHILHQLSMPPAAEYVLLNFQVLLGNDYFANLVQWASMLGSIIVITLIAELLGAGIRGQIISLFIGATIPMGIMQASSAQNDYVAAFFLLCVAFFVLKVESEVFWPNVVGASLAVGLALLTKGTAYLFVLPFGCWLLFLCFKKKGRQLWQPLIAIIAIILLINSGYYMRNLRLFNLPLYTNDNSINEVFAPQNIISNISKSFYLHTFTPFSEINKLTFSGLKKLHQALRIDINDHRSSLTNLDGEGVYAPHEDFIGNPIHLFLIFLCIALFFFDKNKFKAQPHLLYYLICLISGYLLFNVFIKYQPWLNRLTLPTFLLFSPFVGVVIERGIPKKYLMVIFAAIILFIIPPLFLNVKKPVYVPPFLSSRLKYSLFTSPREYLYFTNRAETYESYRKIAATLKKREYMKIGISFIYVEYPLWMILNSARLNYRLEHIDVDNVSKSIPLQFEPDVIIILNDGSQKNRRYMSKYKYFENVGRDNSGSWVQLYGR